MKHKQELVTLYIKDVLQKKRLTNAWLADKLGYTKEAISRMTTGNTMPSVVTLKKIAELLDVSVDELLYGMREEPRLEKYIVKGSYHTKELALVLELRKKNNNNLVFMTNSWDSLKIYCFDKGITIEQLEIVE